MREKLFFKGRALFSAGDKISNKSVLLRGDQFAMHVDSSIICYEEIELGDECLISWECQVMDTYFHNIYLGETLINENRPVVLELINNNR